MRSSLNAKWSLRVGGVTLLASAFFILNYTLCVYARSLGDMESLREYAAFPMNAVINSYRQFFKNDMRSVCPMEPSCSAYGSQVVKKYGTILGFVKTVDRLNRCGHDIYIYSPVRVADRFKLSDAP